MNKNFKKYLSGAAYKELIYNKDYIWVLYKLKTKDGYMIHRDNAPAEYYYGISNKEGHAYFCNKGIRLRGENEQTSKNNYLCGNENAR